MLSDIEISQQAKLVDIREIAKKLAISEDDLELYGKYKAKVTWNLIERVKKNPSGKLVLVTAISPTPAGEGKTTTCVGLADGLQQINKKSMLALREPSLGPCFGMKGGATGGGYAQVAPMEDINLHFTGDFHALTSAHNLIAAILDNHLQQGNSLNIDPRQVMWRRVVDLNDRALRHIIIGLGGKLDGVPRETGFDITVASELMAILCLANDIEDLGARIDNIILPYTYDGTRITPKDLKVTGAALALLKDAIKPNLIQSLEGTPCFMHGGPFANIAHGCNSIIATKTALKLADYVVTEAGFGADLGAEKFLDIKSRIADIKPSVVVLVATVRSLKMNGGLAKNELSLENLNALKAGITNLTKHIENIQAFGLPLVVAINAFPADTKAELDLLTECCNKLGVKVSLSKVWELGGKGAVDLAKHVVELAEQTSHINYTYTLEQPLKDKIYSIATKIYGAKDVSYSATAMKQLNNITKLGFSSAYVCMAKTQYSLSDNPALLGRPEGFTLNIRELRLSSGANFVVAITGDIMTMPGLPKVPAAEAVNLTSLGKIVGLF